MRVNLSYMIAVGGHVLQPDAKGGCSLPEGIESHPDFLAFKERYPGQLEPMDEAPVDAPAEPEDAPARRGRKPKAAEEAPVEAPVDAPAEDAAE